MNFYKNKSDGEYIDSSSNEDSDNAKSAGEEEATRFVCVFTLAEKLAKK